MLARTSLLKFLCRGTNDTSSNRTGRTVPGDGHTADETLFQDSGRSSPFASETALPGGT
jgi:hypothetical protein